MDVRRGIAVSFSKLRNLLTRAAHPATPNAEARTCVRQALKIVPSLEKARFFNPTEFRRAVLWTAQKNGGWYAWVDSLRLSVSPGTVLEKKIFTVVVGDDAHHEIFPDVRSAKEFAEAKAGL